MSRPFSPSLSDKYLAEEGKVLLSGQQALVRLPMVQMRRDRAAGHQTAAFISGYRGSPIGGYDLQLHKAEALLKQENITFQPGINEDLAATAIWGTQQLALSPGARFEGVAGYWYGKGPGVDRSGDVFRHANAAGSAPLGGVLCFAGDDHACKSSTIPHQSDHGFIAASIPFFFPSSINDFLEFGLLATALSRYSGCWTGMKLISDTVETTGVVDLAAERRSFMMPEDFDLPEGGLHLRWPDAPLDQDRRLQLYKLPAVHAFMRANPVNKITLDQPRARFGIAASGRAYEDILAVLIKLGLLETEAAIGIRLLKAAMPWPLDPALISHFAEGLEEVLIIEERREIIEGQVQSLLYHQAASARPRLVGKRDEQGAPFLPVTEVLDQGRLLIALTDRLLKLDLSAEAARHLKAKREAMSAQISQDHSSSPVLRKPYFCAGCPHNRSTKVPEGSRALAGIGCHYLALGMERETSTFTHMGAEGASWAGTCHFTDEAHVFVNLGDGTYVHSGLLAIRQAIASKANLTYKILYNDAVAMTGGQSIDGAMTPEAIAWQLYGEGAKALAIVAEAPEDFNAAHLPPKLTVHPRAELGLVMRQMREIKGCTVILYVQTCAAEKRRRRKRGQLANPAVRAVINPEVCEGCGDCSAQSNCIAIEPIETPMGRKRQINQTSCNKDLSCLEGFCPSFVTLEGAEPGQAEPRATEQETVPLPQPSLPDLEGGALNIVLTGIGGTGIVTVSALLAMAAHLDGKAVLVLDQAGLAQKNGGVFSMIKIAESLSEIMSPRIAPGECDLLLGADDVVSLSTELLPTLDKTRTLGLVNSQHTPVSDFVLHPDFDFQTEAIGAQLQNLLKAESRFVNFSQIAESHFGERVASNVMMLGFAWASGTLPLSEKSLQAAIELNGIAVESNLAAFQLGRRLFADETFAQRVLGKKDKKDEKPITSADLLAHYQQHLTLYQNKALAAQLKGASAKVAAKLGGGPEADLCHQNFIKTYSQIFAFKDEYEVARLLSSPEFCQQITENFRGKSKIWFHLAPPFLPGKDLSGRPKKRRFGAWILPLMRLLAQGKFLRGTLFDPFRFSADRQLERELIEIFEKGLDAWLQRPEIEPALFTPWLEAFAAVRGYGPVKAAAFSRLGENLAGLEQEPIPSSRAA